ncbi:hypothetical protein E7T06_06395 [Deinococcus sp. Arct2-2]|uniref:hypothetical protein n=1 Tax=Deinococcus sp. Arct2-2 TaxID=2568653 RepID=UPI0010A34067|nr:hypothetical protein [Deinococcus sp. Arct2-2]THF70755.1 hypothetical protein E7T06_06395 [Deinococcus sp. Arct2-2]
MSRSRVVGGLLALILLGCGVTIFLDQNGAFGDTPASVVNPVNTPGTPTPQPDTSGADGYGELK